MTDKKAALIITVLSAAVIVFAACGCMFGRYSISLPELVSAIGAKLSGGEIDPNTEIVLFRVRFPRIVAAILVGSGLSVSGAAYQGIFRNPMVSPDLLGASSAAGFGMAVGVLLGMSGTGMLMCSFIMGVAGVTVTYGVAAVIGRRRDNLLTLVLTGLVVSSLFQAFVSIIKLLADPYTTLPEITFLLMGGLNAVSAGDIKLVILPLLIGIVPLFLLRWRFNALALGEDEARTMGISIKRMRFFVIICSTLIVSACVSISGQIGWVGLIIPHFAKMIVGSSYKYVIPASISIGALFLLLVDFFARVILPAEVPLGILTSLIGAPMFIILLLKGAKQET